MDPALNQFRQYQTFKFQQLTESERVNFDQIIQSQSDVDNLNDSVNLMFHSARKNCRLSQAQLDTVALNLSHRTVEKFDAQSVSNVLYGLHPYSTATTSVSTLLMAIVYKVSLCDEDFRAQHIGNALYGMQGLDSKHASVRKLISALAEVISVKQSCDPHSFIV